jgi:hypothetical protein
MPSNPLTRPCFLEIYGVLHRVEVFAIAYIAYAGEREAAQLLPVTRDEPHNPGPGYPPPPRGILRIGTVRYKKGGSKLRRIPGIGGLFGGTPYIKGGDTDGEGLNGSCAENRAADD